MTKTTESLAEFVRRVRSEKGLSCADVEKQSARFGPKIAATYVNRIENGLKTKPSADRLQALARGLDVPVDELWRAVSGQKPSDQEKADEERLVLMFRDLSDEKRSDLLRMIEALHRSHGPRRRRSA